MKKFNGLTKARIATCFHLTIKQASESLGVGDTILKRACRHFKIPRWPKRILKSLNMIINEMELKNITTLNNVSVDQLRNEKYEMMAHGKFTPTFDYETFERVRQQYYKAVHVLRKDPQYVHLQLLQQSLLLMAGITTLA